MRRKVENGNTRVHQGFSDSRGMGSVDRFIGRLPSYPHPRKLKEVPKVLPRVTGVPVHLPSLRAGHDPTGLHNDCKRSETDDPDKGNQTSPVPGRLAHQSPVSRRSTSKHSDSGKHDQVLRVDNKSGKIRTKTYSSVFVRGLRIPSRFSPCKTDSSKMAQTSGFDPTTQVKTGFDCKMFDVTNWVACLNREEGCLHMRPFQFHLKEHWRYPQSLDSLLPWTETISAHLEWWQNPTNVMKGADLHPKDHSIQLFTDASNEGWSAHLEQTSTKGLWSDREKRLHINVLELMAVSLALQSFKDQCQNQTVLVATDNSTVVAYINKQGGTHSAEMCALLWKIITWCHHYQITLKARHIPWCLNGMADLLSRSNQVVTASAGVQADLSQVVHSSCRSIRHSPETQSSNVRISSPSPKCLGHRCSEHKLVGSHCLCLPSYGSPSQGDPKNQAIQLPDHCNSPRLARDALVLGPSAALYRHPTLATSVKNSSQTVPQLCVSQQSSAFQPPHLVSRSGQLQEQGFSVEVAERIATPQRSSTRTIYKSSGPYLRNGAEKIRWISPLPL